MKVVSLISSATETVYALGAGRFLVGRSHECDYPASVSNLPSLTRPAIKTTGSSAGIDKRVKDRLRRALSIYNVDGRRLSELKPDLIITQTQCEVCAVSLKDVKASLGKAPDSKCEILSLKPDDLAALLKDIQRVGAALGRQGAAKSLVARIKGRFRAVAGKARSAKRQPTVALIEWIDPLMAAGNWMPELTRLAGGKPVFGKAGKHSPWLKWDELRAKDPDVIIILPCGFNIPRTRREMRTLTIRRGWEALKAVREGRVFIADGNQYFNRPGPRIAESLEMLAEMIHPELFLFGYRGRGWIKF